MMIGLSAHQLNRASELILVLSIQALGAVRVSDYSEAQVRRACALILLFSPSALDIEGATCIRLDRQWIENAQNTELCSADGYLLNHSPTSTQAILFGHTSGTTGQKKYFLECYSAICAQIELIRIHYFEGDTKHFICLYGIELSSAYVAACAAFQKGGAVIFSSREDFVHAVRTYPRSHANMLLREATFFATTNSVKLPLDQRLASLRVLGAHLPSRVRMRLAEDLALVVKNSYSSNEAGQIAEVLPNGEARIYPGVELQIVDGQGQALPNGSLGRVATRSAQQISAYLWNPSLNAHHFRDGWFISHDMAYLAANGSLVLVDRADHMLNLGGIKISPKPFEDKIKQLACIRDCVLMAENEHFDVETLLVGIETTQAVDHAAFNTAIGAILQEAFAACRIFYVQEFPRTETGKVKRHVLRAHFLKESSSAGIAAWGHAAPKVDKPV